MPSALDGISVSPAAAPATPAPKPTSVLDSISLDGGAQAPVSGSVPPSPTPNLAALIHTYAGGDEKLERLGRIVAGIESAGGRAPANVRSRAGAIGLMQIMPDTGTTYGVTPAQLADPNTNVRIGMRELARNLKVFGGDPIRAAQAYNMGTAGLQGDLVHSTPLPRETQAYGADVQAAWNEATPAPSTAPARPEPSVQNQTLDAYAARATPAATAHPKKNVLDTITLTPTPHAGTSPDDTSQQAPAGLRRSTPLDTIFNAGDIGFFEYSAMRRDAGAGNTNEVGRVNAMLAAGKLDEVAQKYNLMSPEQLLFESQHGDHLAGWFLQHPFAAGIAQGFAELANPAYLGVGKVFELGAGTLRLGGQAVRQIPAVARAIDAMAPHLRPLAVAITNAMSPFRSVVLAGGQSGKRWAQALAQRAASAPAQAQAMALKIFGGLSPLEQEDVVHLWQGFGFGPSSGGGFSRNAIQTTDPARLAVLHERATTLGAFVTDVTNQKVGAGLIQQQTAEARERFFPMGGAYDRPGTPAEKEYWEAAGQADPRMKGGKLFSAGTEHTQTQYGSLAEAQRHAKVGLKDDFSAPVQLEHWATSSLQRLDLDAAIARAPTSLVRPITAGFSIANGPRDLDGERMVRWEDAVKHNADLAGIDSPQLKGSLVSPKFAQWLADNRTRLYSDAKLFSSTTSIGGKVLNKGLQLWDGLTEIQRKAILANPLTHPIFNLANNAAGAGLPLHEVAGLVTKSIINAFGGGRLLAKFEPNATAYTQWVQDAYRAGAIAEMKAGDTRLLAARYQDLSPAKKFLKVGDDLNAWHNRLTFGRHGEEAFSVALYRHLMQSGRYTAEEAGGLVREALGNYQNVSRSGVDAIAARTLFFYPWLKGNLPFWIRTMTTRPQLAAAPHQAARANNALVGDPSETRGKNAQPATDFAWITGNKEAGYVTHVPLLPQRMLTEPATLLSGDPSAIMKAAVTLVRSRLRPRLGFAVDTVTTAFGPADSPLDPRSYHTVFDRRAPLKEQLKEFGANFVGEVAPIPVLQYAVQNALRRGVSMGQVLQTIEDRGIGDFSYASLSSAQQQGLKRANSSFSQQVAKIPKTLTWTERQRRLTKCFTTYSKNVNGVLNPQPVQTRTPQ